MCIAPEIYAKTHFPSCSIKEAKFNKTMNVPKYFLLQLILDEQVATSIEQFKQLPTLVHSIHYIELKDTKVKDKLLNTESRI